MKLQRKQINFKNAILLSLLLHGLLALFLSRPQKIESDNSHNISVEILEPEKFVTKNIDPALKQIVEQNEKSLNNEKPLKDAYLSANDQRVQKETVARLKGDFKNSKDKFDSQQNANQANQRQLAPQNQMLRPKIQDLMGNSALALLKKQEELSAGEDKKPGEGSSEASRSSDYLKNVDVADETYLNTREFKYYTYYSRIRRQLSQHWEPSVKSKMTKLFAQGRRIASEQDLITKLLITLNSEGNLVKVQVLSESGIQDLDSAATEAFRSAAPFPNPPKGIVEADGTVKIRWDFVLES